MGTGERTASTAPTLSSPVVRRPSYPRDAPYSLPEAQLRAGPCILSDFACGAEPPVIFVPGTGSYGGSGFEPNLRKPLAQCPVCHARRRPAERREYCLCHRLRVRRLRCWWYPQCQPDHPFVGRAVVPVGPDVLAVDPRQGHQPARRSRRGVGPLRPGHPGADLRLQVRPGAAPGFLRHSPIRASWTRWCSHNRAPATRRNPATSET